jgi:hypothetical protein
MSREKCVRKAKKGPARGSQSPREGASHACSSILKTLDSAQFCF